MIDSVILTTIHETAAMAPPIIAMQTVTEGAIAVKAVPFFIATPTPAKIIPVAINRANSFSKKYRKLAPIKLKRATVIAKNKGWQRWR